MSFFYLKHQSKTKTADMLTKLIYKYCERGLSVLSLAPFTTLLFLSSPTLALNLDRKAVRFISQHFFVLKFSPDNDFNIFSGTS